MTIAGLDCGGGSPAAAAFNLEIVMRLFFATPAVRGVYFAGLYGPAMEEPASALLEEDGTPTPCGAVLDALFRELWWTDHAALTDESGSASQRVYTGWYRVTATLPDGRVLETEAYLPKSEDTRYIVLQAVPR